MQANVETNVKQNEELSKRAIPGVTKYLAALRHAQGAYLIEQLHYNFSDASICFVLELCCRY
jgi:hypothetical protein